MLGATALAAGGARAQGVAAESPAVSVALARALDLEAADKAAPAAAAFRVALAAAEATGPPGTDARDAALLGLERVWGALGRPDSVLSLAADVLARRPADGVAHAIALRTYAATGRDAEARTAFARWRGALPHSATPYVEYARLLLDARRWGAADSVLRDGRAALADAESRRALAPLGAQLLASTGAWAAAGAAWRDVVVDDRELDRAAVFSLFPAPEAARDSALAPLLAPDAAASRTIGARRAAVMLLAMWRRGGAAWHAAAGLPADSATVDLWRDVAAQLDAAEQWGDAARAWTAVGAAPLGVTPLGDAAARRDAAMHALSAAARSGDAGLARAALDLVEHDPRLRADATLVPWRARALAAAGRPDDAERLVGAGALAPDVAQAVAGAWAARGELARADAALARAAGGVDTGSAAGWLALYRGDLRRARSLFGRGGDAGADASDDLLGDVRQAARSALARTRADSAPSLGAALRAAARGDARDAAAALDRAATELPDAAATLRLAGASAALRGGDAGGAAARWRTILADTPDAPEAPAADLAWARALARGGDRAGARARLEHAITTYPESALTPLARLALQQLGG